MNTIRHAVRLAMGIASFGLLGSALAHQPLVDITSPTGTVYLASFPADVPVAFTVSHPDGEVRQLNVLEVTVDNAVITNGGFSLGSPFQGPGNVNSCAKVLGTAGFSSCNLIDSSNVEVGANWTVPGPGNYVLAVSVRHTNEIGEDSEEVAIMTLSAEFPAPPAVANAYINAQYPSIKGKVRGCVISAIAELHAKDSAYGPKGGPYADAVIRNDVDDFRGLCGG